MYIHTFVSYNSRFDFINLDFLNLSEIRNCRAVLAELSKIERFNAITTNTLPDSVANWGCGQLIGGRGELIDGCGQPEVPLFVRDALKQTENVVHDIDAILEK